MRMTQQPKNQPETFRPTAAVRNFTRSVWPSCQMTLLLADCAALFTTAFAVGLIRDLFGGSLNASLHMHLTLFLFMVPLINYSNELYAAIPPALPEELRCLAQSTTLAYLCIGIFFLLNRSVELPSRMVILCAWVLSLVTVPLARAYARKCFAHKPWWGVPTVVFGQGTLPVRLIRTLQKNPALGLRPTAFVPQESGSSLAPPELTVLDENTLDIYLKKHADVCALMVIPANENTRCNRYVHTVIQNFSKVILVPQEFASGEISFWVRPLELGSVIGLKIRQNLLDPRRLALKRLVDWVCALVGGLVLLPFFVGIGAAIVVESPGSPFFRQKRIGRNGKTIQIVKFRTMVPDAEARLEQCLASDPALRAEWKADQKLRDDPRITKIGRWLRKTSLDELPQIWNVLWGDMSLVGPRPIVHNEIAKYGDAFAAYMRVRPGITGLWQVSGRNDLTYAERVQIDRYYICNWSTWLDVLILAKTVPVVFLGKGAY